MRALAVVICGPLALATAGAYGEVADVTAKRDALEYLSNLDKDAQIFVRPTRSRPYEIVNGNIEINNSVSAYINNHQGTLDLVNYFGIVQISIVSIPQYTFSDDIARSLEKSRLLPSYKSFAYNAALNADGCTAYRFIDRKKWASVGLIFIDQTRFGIGNVAKTNGCIFGALDYVNGFPTKGNYFEYTSLPQEPVRKLILDAIYKCATEGDNKSQQEETTRDGITPLPSLGCVAAKIKQ